MATKKLEIDVEQIELQTLEKLRAYGWEVPTTIRKMTDEEFRDYFAFNVYRNRENKAFWFAWQRQRQLLINSVHKTFERLFADYFKE